MGYVLRDHPEIVWTNGRWRGKAGATSIVMPEYTLDEAGIQAFQKETSIMEEILHELSACAEVDRVRWVFDFLLQNVVYDLQAPHSQDAYGALVEGRAVCRGIAKATQLLLRTCGLQAVIIDGQLCEEALHVWNIVSLSDGCYHLDVTMGYPMFSSLYTRRGLPYNTYAAFCVSDETLCRTHRWDAGNFPIHCLNDLIKH